MTMTTEIWRRVPNYSKYFVSNHGRVRNEKGFLLKTSPQHSGYIRIKIINDKQQKKHVQVHRLVCTAFRTNIENKPTVNHKDHNKWNNHLDNLEWASVSEQNHHRRFLKQTYRSIEDHPMDTWVRIPPSLIHNTSIPYYISAKGRVKNIKGLISSGFQHGGYISVTIQSRKYALHILIAKVFLPNVENKPYVNHKDGNKENAKLSNLEWCTPSENSQHALENDLLPYCTPVKVCDITEHTQTTFHSIRQAQRTMRIGFRTIKKHLGQHTLYKKKFIFKS